MSYLITYRRRNGQRTLAISDYDSTDERDAKTFCQALAEDMELVVLYAMAEDGLLTPVVKYRASRNGKVRSQRIATDTLTPPTGRPARTNSTAAAAEPEPEAEADEPEDVDETDDDSGETYEGYCVKCRAKREFHGHIEESDNGRRMAKGTCPVCGTKMNRILKNIPHDEQDDYHTPDDPDENPDDNPYVEGLDDDPELGEMAEQVTEAIAEAAAGKPAEEIAEVVSAVAAEFSDAAAEAEAEAIRKAATPRKRTPKKAKGADNRTPNQRAAANPTKATCPQCDESVDVIQRAGIAIFTVHPNKAKGLDRCVGSTTEVSQING